ncbi:hypothetical protein MASR2M15_01950 [Anaerolineales bacterium]
MNTQSTHRFWRLMPILIILVLLASACYQQAGDSSGNEPTLISQSLATNTPFPSPTATDTPEEVTEDLATDSDIQIVAQVEEDASPTPSPTVTENPLILTATAQSVAQANEPDPFQLSATALVAQITQTVEIAMTQTAESMMILTPSPLPPIGITSTPGGFFMTATPEFGFPTTQPPLGGGGSCTHVVQAGVNLWRVSLRYGVPVDTIAAANGITNIQMIVVGQQLVVPGCNSGGSGFPPTGGSAPVGGTCNPQPSGAVHTVQQGETLFQISLRYGVSVNSISLINNISNINLIYMTQQLQIPTC